MILKLYAKTLVTLSLFMSFPIQVYTKNKMGTLTYLSRESDMISKTSIDTLEKSVTTFSSAHRPTSHGKLLDEEGTNMSSDHRPASKVTLEEETDVSKPLDPPVRPEHGNIVPRIDINIDGGAIVADKKNFLKAQIKIDGAGFYSNLTDSVWIRGRGNSSWNGANPYGKNPYRLKFRKAVAPFELRKGKNWILLSNKEKHSLMANAIGMKLSRLVKTKAANHIIPVELFINGQYRGNYNFTEKVGLSNNSVKLENESRAALLELDSYYDETYKFYSSTYNLPVNIKDYHFKKDEIPVMLNHIQSDFNQLCFALKNEGKISHLVDVEQLARYLMVNELLGNYEIMHPKSVFLYKEDFTSTNSKFIFGPIWDLNWAFGYEQNRDYGTTNPEIDFWEAPANFKNQQFIYDLRFKDKAVEQAYYKVWSDFMANHLQELLNYCDDYYQYVELSFLRNADKWNDGQDYKTVAHNMKRWLEKRAKYIYSHLSTTTLSQNEVTITDISKGDKNMVVNDFVDVYTLQGVRIKSHIPANEVYKGLMPGIYIIGNRKVVVPGL